MVRGHPLQLQELRHLLALPARGAIDNGAPGRSRRQVPGQHLVDVGEFLAPGGGHDLEGQIGSLHAAVDDGQFDPEPVAEVAGDVVNHVRFGGGGETQHRRRVAAIGPLPDEAAHVDVVGPEVVAPTRQAVGFVQYPGADLALAQGAAQRGRPELLGRYEQDPCIPQPHPVQRVGALGHGQQPVDRDATTDAVRLQPRHLIRHQRHQRRDHHCQRAGLVVARQRRNLVAERLARTRGQDPEHVLP